MKKSIFVVKILFSLLLISIVFLPMLILTASADTITTTICAADEASAKNASGYSNCSITTTTVLKCTSPSVAFYCSQDASIQTDEYTEGMTRELEAISKNQTQFKGTVLAPTKFTLAPIPGIQYESMESYLESIYRWGIGLVGVLTLIQLIRGGLMYMVSGAVEQKANAKGIITDALIGLVLALASFIIINVLNPRLTIITEPVLETPSSTEAITEVGTIARCMPYAELQNYIDNQYNCDPRGDIQGPCPSGQGYYICSPPAAQ
ncbi:hypothetical protein A2907_01050 [Candidatus Azambacteria bacterium RIFCSPLOWO2_01_FULL_37_9]|uniref:Uncharacterized protein n=1 Tax=Candidatus Azambacteria bacterium RIFCSPLOWO2_01_FULL_37_9 TaxID=1797297 RepID=A0A1F5C856_9BACT|nr:MAG: hypothetical protein A2907_01050 [Candidatus Azambacteria bacterium RIFCSPLOWO2_01_FULL_37_9]